ncbi:hypothetical protein ESCO_005805 [Escovopsis weberi]|uniref:L-ascorbic acid binding protein n=1 Tax=Escovopsis weberi TaxID=150374 RepID=A0A0M9VUG6_ESCWE|nr:hypothetical protein ESCO_005805 [Escovopsis weberi]
MDPDADARKRFIKAMETVYGPFDSLTLEQTAEWMPPSNPGAGGHRGRYLWTDAFGVVNFVTLYTETSDERYLHLAKRLVTAVHDILGSKRDGSGRLDGATDEEPLKGGLRIGKMSASGMDGDGQYHHYLTLWMFALNRVSVASGERSYNDLAIELAEAIHARFVTRATVASQPRMVWKVSTDMKTVLVPSEGHLDAATGFAVFKLLRDTAHRQRKGKGKGQDRTLYGEIQEYAAVTARSRFFTPSADPLDLGMGLWVSQFCDDEDGASWADEYRGDALLQAAEVVPQLILLGERDPAGARMRLAFREFGLCLGVGCVEADERLRMWRFDEGI